MGDGVVVMVDGRAKVLQRACHPDDELLRSLLRTRPDLVLGAAAPGDRRRLLLVTDTDVPPLQRVYVDSEAVPLLVGVQTTGRDWGDGDVLLRLLDRVALELPPWRQGRLRRQARATHHDRDEAELLTQALDWRADPDTFWSRVESNLAREHVRIVLVTDRMPDELIRVVEFLDARLPDVEVRAVEVSLYGAGSVSALVPRATRPGSAAPGARHEQPPPELTALAARAAPGADGPGRHRLRG
jgi:hypothetical protein